MKSNKTMIFFLLALMLVGNVAADGLSVQLKRTNPGIAGSKPAELIFDVVNTDLNHRIEGFIWCRSPDDSVVSSTLGASIGSGAQYVSDRFFMDTGPTQKAISLTIDSNSEGDKNAGCILKYIPYKETVIAGEPIVKKVDFKGTVGKTDTNVNGYKVKISDYKLSQEEVKEGDKTVNKTTSQSVKVIVNDIPKEVQVGKEERINDLSVKLVSASQESADVEIHGEITTNTQGSVTKQYKKTNGEYVSSVTDDNYRELRLDKIVPFVQAPKSVEVKCPEGKTSCSSNEVQIMNAGIFGIPVIWFVVILALVVLGVVYLFGRTYKRD